MAKDFRKKNFGKVLRGYAPEEVDEYLVYVNEEYRKIERRAADYERKLTLALKKLDEKMNENAEAKTAGTEAADQKRADEAYMKAVQEAESILSEAETAAVNIREAAIAESEKKLVEAETAARIIIESAEAEVKKAREQAAGIYDAASEMYDEVRSFKDSLFSLYNSHIESVESIEASAESYIAGIDRGYSEISGETVNRDEYEDDDSGEEIYADETGEYADSNEYEKYEEYTGDAEEYEAFAEKSEEYEAFAEEAAPEVETPAKDIYIDLDDEAYADEADDAEQPVGVSAEEDDSAATRVLRLSAISEAFAKDGLDLFDDENNEDLAAGDDEGYYDEEAEEEYAEEEYDDAFDDFEDETAAFKDMDALFTPESGKEYKQKDEFDIVFAEADSKRNVDEIRRQPIVAPEEPRNPKKHSKF